MRKRIITAVLGAVLLTAPLSLKADEGMWLLQLLKEQNTIDLMRKQGLRMEADSIYSTSNLSLKDAVGIFDGGCTGEIVSPEGLILTNHHCGYSAIQMHSSVEHDYLTDGFWAMNKNEELPTEGMTFYFVNRIEDVTQVVEDNILSGKVDKYTALTRNYLRDLSQELFEKSDLYGKPGIEPELLPYYAGNKFYLVYYKVYTDIRMVAAPPSSIGKFGGETDNWMWPRHTCDFSVFRIYASPDGEPADYAPENVPLKTPKFLKISVEGLSEGDYAMILGFPGSTSRYLTQAEVMERMESINQARIDIRNVRLEVLREEMAKSDAIRIQYADKFASSSNYWKNSIGMNEAIIDNKVLETKAEQEKAFNAYAQDHSEYNGIVDQITRTIKARLPLSRQVYYLNEAMSAIEFGSPYNVMDNLRDAIEKKQDLTQAKALLESAFEQIHNKDYDHEVDRKVAKAVLPKLRESLSESEIPDFYAYIDSHFKGDINAFVDAMYDKSILASRQNLNAFLKKPTIKAIDNDIATIYSRSRMQKFQEARESYTAAGKELGLLQKDYVRGLGEMNAPKPSYPDANFTMRLTYGNVKSYDPKDAVHYKYYSTADGVLEKEDPTNPEFVVPAKLKELIESRDYGRYGTADGYLPACFLTTNDITGGNSGSPVLNADGNLIGLAFDGNWESLSGDINFDDNLQRCINVDIRYVLFVIERLGLCQRLIDEMTIIE